MKQPIKVLYIAGAGRSGSTVLGDVLGQVNGFTHIGEVYYFYSHGLKQNHLCGCGLPVRECPRWNAVIREAYGTLGEDAAMELAARRAKAFGGRILPPPITVAGWHLKRKRARHIAELENLYLAIQTVSGARVIVDGSKVHMQALALSMMPNVELFVLHLARDPRGVTYSWRKKKRSVGAGREFMDQYGAFRTCLKWLSRNLYVGLLRKYPGVNYRFLRYEEFIERPRTTVSSLLNWIGEESRLDCFSAEQVAEFTVMQHSIHGNPGRFRKSSTVRFELDTDWKQKLAGRDKLITEILTGPLLKKYGY